MATTGAVIWRGNTTVPSGYLLCDGTAVSRTTYAALFTAIGTNYGAGDGSTTFNVPNLVARYPVGANNTTVVRGNTGGAANHTHTGNSHTHGVAQPSDHGTHATGGGHQHDAHTTTSLTGGSGATSLATTGTHTSGGGHTHDAHSAHSGFATQANTGTTGGASPPFIELVPVIKT